MKYIITILLGLMALTSQAQKKTYEYDDVQRLSKINVWSGSTVAHSIVYSYDELGNRTSKVITTGSCQTAIATLTGTQSITSGSVATLTVSFTGAMPYSFVFNGQTYSNINVSSYSLTVSPTQNTTYSLSSVSNSCGTGSVSGEAIVTVTTPCSGVATPIITATPSVVAVGQSAVLSVANCSGTVNWFNSNTSTTSLASGNTYTTPALSNTTIYYADCSNNGCTSTSRGSQTVSVNNCGTQTATINPNRINAGESSTLTLNGCVGTVTWDNNLGSGNLKVVSPTATAFYYATCITSGCTNTVTPFRVNVNCTSLVPIVPPVTIFSGQTATLTASGCTGGSIEWDDEIGNYLGSGTVFTSPVLTSSTNYYAFCIINNCASSTTTAVVTVNPLSLLNNPLLVSPLNVSSLPYATTVNLQWSANGNPAGTIYYPKLRDLTTGLLVFDYTNVGSATSYTANVIAGHDYRWVVQARKTGYTNGDSQEFTFSIQLASYNLELGSCIVVSPNPLVQEQNKSFTYSVKNSGNANFVGTIKLTINRPDGTTDVVDEHLNITITPNQTVSYSTVPNNLSSTTNPIGTSYQFAVVAFINGTGGGAAVNSISGCSNPLITSVIANPNCIAPTVSSATINSGQIATLTATGCTGTVNWYDMSTGGTSLGVGIAFTTPALTTNTTYYADCSVNGCVSPTRGSGTITVNTISCPIPTGMQWQNTFPTSFQPYWQGVAGNNYVVRYRISGTTNWTETALISCTQTGLVITTLSGLTNGQTYEWQVKTVCSGTNSSAYSTSTFSATYCREATLTVPTGTNLTATTANIQWNSTPVNVNLRFRVVGATMWNTANNLTSSQTWLTGLLPSTNYEAQVQTICSGGILSAFTTSINFITLNCSNMYSLKTGNWNDITVWSCGRVPTNTDIITIKANHFITIPATYIANAKNVVFEIGGKIIEAANTSKLCLSCPQIPTNGLVLYLPFNGNTTDASGNNNNGIVAGAILGNDRFGVANKAFRFNDGSKITVPNSASLSLTNAFSVSVWVNMQSTTGRNGNNVVTTNSEQCIFTKDCDNGTLRSAIYPQTDGSFLLQTYANVGDQTIILFQLNQWKQISLTYDGSTLKQFVNGNLVSTKTATLNLDLSNSSNLVIGNMGCFVYYFNGFIDEFRMYNRSLSNAEILDIYNGERP